MKLFISSLLLVTAIFISGCTYTDYQYVPPQSPSGKQCVYDCEYEKERCSADEERASQELRMRYEREMRSYNRCKERQGTGKNTYRCDRPYQEYAQGFNCHRIYKACFKRCGGRIIAVEKKL